MYIEMEISFIKNNQVDITHGLRIHQISTNEFELVGMGQVFLLDEERNFLTSKMLDKIIFGGEGSKESKNLLQSMN